MGGPDEPLKMEGGTCKLCRSTGLTDCFSLEFLYAWYGYMCFLVQSVFMYVEFMYFRAVDSLIQFSAGLVVCLNLIVHLA